MESNQNKRTPTPEFLQGGGEMGERIRQFNWADTSLGPVEDWPQSLRTCVRIMLASRQPIWIGWGKELIKLYNDPYIAIVGGKHPWALGKPASVVWKDIWSDIAPMLEQVMEKDQGTYVESQLLIMERNGYPEETFYTFSYTPIPGDNGATEGMICANTDDTERIIGERQLKTITELAKELGDSVSTNDTIEKTIRTLSRNNHDFPSVFYYGLSNSTLHLYPSGNNDLPDAVAPVSIEMDGDSEPGAKFAEAAWERKLVVLENAKRFFGQPAAGVWRARANKAAILPISQTGSRVPYGFLVVELNPFRLLDEKYSSFLTLVADQVASSFTDLTVLYEERKRAEALAELDRAKTTFFSNISHEFRTPLTLLLGPIEETLQEPQQDADALKRKMDVAYRNARRLQRLVNTLLDFSRIEAGRLDGKFTRVDICRLTTDLTSTFRSAIERSGMTLAVHCDDIKEPVYVDTDMWERIVVNLVSNAFKYSRAGAITVTVRKSGDDIQLTVSDTGIGIPADQLDKIFDRFHRIDNMEGRSKEGTGIGLAMVKELVRIHHGTIHVESEAGKGSTFTVTIPAGDAHLSPERIINADDDAPRLSVHSSDLAEEALKWDDQPEPVTTYLQRDEKNNGKFTVLLADDNADMRDYVSRLLSAHFNVIPVMNGEDALAKAIETGPDLILSDVMMPRLDGFGLLKELRALEATRNIPVILLSARAGEDEKIEGLEAGADDYLVKPFSAKELLARVDANIRIANARNAGEQNLKNIILQSPVAMTILRGRDFVIELANDKALELWGKGPGVNLHGPAFEAFPELRENFEKILTNVWETGIPFVASEMPVTINQATGMRTLYVNLIYQTLNDSEGKTNGIIGIGIDVSEQVKARHKIEAAEAKALLAIDAADLGTFELDRKTNVLHSSPRFQEIWGLNRDVRREDFESRIHPDDLPIRAAAHAAALQTGNLAYECRIRLDDGSIRWIRIKGRVNFDEHHDATNLIGVVQDITAEKGSTEQLIQVVNDRTQELKRSNEDLQQFAHVASHDLKEPVRKIKTYTNRLQEEFGGALPEKAKVYLDKIQQSGSRVMTMIDGVLNYSTLEGAEDIKERIDMNEVVANVESDLEVALQRKGVKLIKSPLPSIEGTPVLIHQLMYNIINNAVKFSRESVTPTIRISGRLLKQEGVEMAEYVIEDNGMGFSNEYADLIFNIFSRLNSKDQFEGTGLGLALCKKIVERHKGTISASGSPDQGAAFTITLPVKYQGA
jgi:PAS domain S-box-containing protein